jgi:ADP-ribosylglycohydrolase
MTSTNTTRFARARLALEGLSIGDAFGERFFLRPGDVWDGQPVVSAGIAERLLDLRALPASPWRYTDDTEMALSIVSVLRRHGAIDQGALAQSFAERYDPSRGYGPAMHRLLRQIGAGDPWQEAAASLFEGQGSFGNGASMRVAPVGAYFADDLDQVVEQARRSAEVTHAHPEGIAGAVAVAVAAAWAWRIGQGGAPTFASLIDLVLQYVPQSEVRSRLRRANDLSPGMPAQYCAALLGNGSAISAQDTVPYAIWCAGSYLNDYEAALWHTASGLGDVDTNCAIVGGILALAVGPDGIPAEWRESREPLPNWPFDDSFQATITLYRPVGPSELALIEQSGYRAFPPRLPEQPIFYPVLNEAYAAQIARDWNAKDGKSGYVTRFQVQVAFLERYPIQVVGNALHAEHWIPAGDLAEFNANIVGPIEVIATFELGD